MDPLEAGAVHQAMPQGVIQHGAPNSRASSTGNRQTSNERPTQSTHATGEAILATWAYKPEEESHGPSGKRSR